ncbi:flagellar hook-associated protein FlgK [Planctomycetota bacterium]
MANFDISLSGIHAAQNAFNIIGNNIANAATEGYHRQRIDFTPAYSSSQGATMIGGGVEVAGIVRMIDKLLEQEIYQQQSSMEQTSQELATLRTIESIFGELSSVDGGLSTTIDKFFTSMKQLSDFPDQDTYQYQVVSNADAMAGQFRNISDSLGKLQTQISLELEVEVDTINTLTTQIAQLNDKISDAQVSENDTSSMSDKRDQYISQLSNLIGIQTQNREYGVVDVATSGMLLVASSRPYQLQSGINTSGDLGLSMVGAPDYNSNITGGTIGGLLSLKNTLVSDIQTKLDSLATAISQEINQYHVQGVGSAGSFASLTSLSMTTGDLSSISGVVDGEVYVRVTNTSTGVVTRTEISIDADDNDAGCDSLTEVTAAIDAITGLSASVNSATNELVITVDTNYEFDFLPGVLTTPTSTSFVDASPPTVTVSGIYTGTTNQTYTFTVKGDDGLVGNGTLQLEVTDGDSQVVTTVNIGSGYVAGEEIEIGTTGIRIALTAGVLDETTNDDSFTVQALADSDTSGLLSAIGLNTFFTGTNASNIAVHADIAATPGRVATSIGPEMTDNTNAERMAELKDQAITGLSNMTCEDFYRRLTFDIAQEVSIKEMQYNNCEAIKNNLLTQQGEISGVNINDEAAQLLIFEQMFQAMAKYMSIVQESVSELISMV